MRRPCIGCGTPTPGARCPTCQTGWNQARGSSHQRGYGQAWRTLRDPIIQDHIDQHGLWCPGYRVPAHAVASKTNLSADHKQPKARGGRDTESNITVLCTPCNARKRDH